MLIHFVTLPNFNATFGRPSKDAGSHSSTNLCRQQYVALFFMKKRCEIYLIKNWMQKTTIFTAWVLKGKRRDQIQHAAFGPLKIQKAIFNSY